MLWRIWALARERERERERERGRENETESECEVCREAWREREREREGQFAHRGPSWRAVQKVDSPEACVWHWEAFIL